MILLHLLVLDRLCTGWHQFEDPSYKIIKVHLAALKWNILQRRFGLVAADLERLQGSSVELLDLLKLNLPERTGGAEGWNFEKHTAS